ncbi:MAG: hypothetical protein RLZZ416_474 [Candidatus Parcubacteria bacterium]|jgi:hypothetical protein
MNNKLIAGTVIGLIIGGGGGFYGGMKYQQGQRSTFGNSQFPANAGNFAGRAGAGSARGGVNAVFGKVIAKDATSITVELIQGGPSATSTNGGSSGTRIALYDASTEVSKTVAGSSADLKVGESVVVNGTQNTDGSITARMIQIRPAGSVPRPQ